MRFPLGGINNGGQDDNNEESGKKPFGRPKGTTKVEMTLKGKRKKEAKDKLKFADEMKKKASNFYNHEISEQELLTEFLVRIETVSDIPTAE